ncbi:hypothetical protein GQ44DRAFT_737117 [Phaeosphaeriaceae sp. PMI808]|nr:hypothetical protein GQ44DRAFT_737117 [Phaeosphaeriaceae sp. PMI808]
MPQLEEVIYSEAACATIFSNYFKFFTKVYLDDTAVEWPPEGGWPTITTDAFGSLEKSDTVIPLLRHLPYIQIADPRPLPGPYFATRKDSQGSHVFNDVNPHIIGLIEGGRSSPFMLLDTQHGVVYWPDCDDEIRDDTPQEKIEDSPHDWAPSPEADRRENYAKEKCLEEVKRTIRERFPNFDPF